MTRSTPPNCLSAFQPVYTLIVFKYRTPRTEVVYPHQSIFRALEEGGTHGRYKTQVIGSQVIVLGCFSIGKTMTCDLCFVRAGEHISSRHFVPTDQNKLCTHDKNRKRAELWVKNNLFNVFVMYALDSAHVKFDV